MAHTIKQITVLGVGREKEEEEEVSIHVCCHIYM